MGLGNIQSINPNNAFPLDGLINDQPNTQQSLNTPDFNQVLQDAQTRQMGLEIFLKHQLIGKKITASKNGKAEYTGMITKVYEDKDNRLIAEIWEPRVKNKPRMVEIKFEQQSKIPEAVDQKSRQEHYQALENLKRESYFNSTELIGTSQLNVPNIPEPNQFRQLPKPRLYYDVNNKEKQGLVLLKNNKLYLDDRTRLHIRYETL